jgi:drug/metabolite transporter (DMT)-like permease
MDHSEQRRGALAMAICAVLWSSGGLFIKIVEWHPLAIAGVRSAVAGLVILAAVGRPRFTFSVDQILATVFHTGTMVLFVASTRTTTAANAIFLQFTAPVYVAFLGWWILGEKPAGHHWAALAAVGIGMGLLFRDQIGSGGRLGNILGAASGVSFGLFSVFMRRQKDGSPLESLLLSNLLTVLIGIPFYTKAVPTDGISWAAMAALGIFQTGLSLLLFTRAIKRITALSAMLISSLEPLLNPVWVFWVTGERPGVWGVLGGLVILASVTTSSILSIRSPRRS